MGIYVVNRIPQLALQKACHAALLQEWHHALGSYGPMSRFEQLQWDLVSRLLDLGEDVDSRDYSIEVSPALITAVAEGKFAFISGSNFHTETL